MTAGCLVCLLGICFTLTMTVFKVETTSSAPVLKATALEAVRNDESTESVESFVISEPEVTEILNQIESSHVDVILLDTPIVFTELDFKARYDFDSNDTFITELENSILKIETALATNEYTEEACIIMEQELDRLNDLLKQAKSEVVHHVASLGEYTYATKVWEYFRQKGYSKAVTSAIIGNMMVETSGGSLALNPTIYDSTGGYYGLCQWSLYYRPEVAGMSFENQLKYLDASMEKEFRNFGKCYKEDFTYEDFLAMTDPAEAALAFAKVYERCGSGSYEKRKEAARTAYNYFANSK